MSSGTVEVYYVDSSVESVERTLRPYSEAGPDSRGVIFYNTAAEVEDRWPSRRGLAKMRRLGKKLAEDLYFHTFAERVSRSLDGRAFCLRTEQVKGITFVHVVPKED